MLYWIEKTGGTIRRCRYDKCDHGDVEVVKDGLKFPEGIAFDVPHQMLYWCNTGENLIQRCEPDDCDSTTEDVMTHQQIQKPIRLAIDSEAGFLYWIEHTVNRVMRCNMNMVPCGNVETVLVNTVTNGDAKAIAIDPANKMLYWASSRQVHRCNVHEHEELPCLGESVMGERNNSLGDNGEIVGIALDLKKRKVYWSLQNRIEECPMEPGQKESNIRLVTKGINLVRALAIDSLSTTLYMAEGVSGGIQSRIRYCDAYHDEGSCAVPNTLIGSCPGTGCMNMPFDVVLDWSEDSIYEELLTDSDSPADDEAGSTASRSYDIDDSPDATLLGAASGAPEQDGMIGTPGSLEPPSSISSENGGNLDVAPIDAEADQTEATSSENEATSSVGIDQDGETTEDLSVISGRSSEDESPPLDEDMSPGALDVSPPSSSPFETPQNILVAEAADSLDTAGLRAGAEPDAHAAGEVLS